MVQAQWGVAGVEKVPDPGPSAKLSGGPSASRPGTWRGSYTGQAPGKEKRGEARVFPGEEKGRSSRGATADRVRCASACLEEAGLSAWS